MGQSEENIRNLFADAEKEMKEKGDNSSLHIIIFDEIDAICKQRGSVRDGSGVHDTVVNQLLTKVGGPGCVGGGLRQRQRVGQWVGGGGGGGVDLGRSRSPAGRHGSTKVGERPGGGGEVAV